MYVGWEPAKRSRRGGTLYSTGVDTSVGWSRMNDGEVVQSWKRVSFRLDEPDSGA
jgi:hypothetical protein